MHLFEIKQVSSFVSYNASSNLQNSESKLKFQIFIGFAYLHSYLYGQIELQKLRHDKVKSMMLIHGLLLVSQDRYLIRSYQLSKKKSMQTIGSNR